MDTIKSLQDTRERCKKEARDARERYVDILRTARNELEGEIARMNAGEVINPDMFERETFAVRNLMQSADRAADEVLNARHTIGQIEDDIEEKKRNNEEIVNDPSALLDQIRSYGFEGLGKSDETLDDDTETIWQTLIDDDLVDESDETHYYLVVNAAREYLEEQR